MKRLLLTGPLVALLALSKLPTAQAATRPALAATATAADPYSQYYPQGVASAESFLGIQPDGSQPSPAYRTPEEIWNERAKAEELRDRATTLNEYYYLSGYIDRLGQY